MFRRKAAIVSVALSHDGSRSRTPAPHLGLEARIVGRRPTAMGRSPAACREALLQLVVEARVVGDAHEEDAARPHDADHLAEDLTPRAHQM
jgi:hypothetical protein